MNQSLQDLEKKLKKLRKRNECDHRALATLRVDRLNMSSTQTVSIDEEIRKLIPEIMDQETRITELQTAIHQIRVDEEKYRLTIL